MGRMRKFFGLALVLAAMTMTAAAQESLHLPATVTAGNALLLPSVGGGEGTLYVFGPGGASKKQVSLGADISVSGEQLLAAGRYTILLCSQSCRSGNFFVTSAK